MDRLWEHTQVPELHQRWDLRFSTIDYLPRPTETEPQRFRYATRIGFGLPIEGAGESMGQKDLADGSRSSALRFSSEDSRSLIREGSGYWKYIPNGDGIRFLTWYDYEPRFGILGRLVDRLAFRPLLGWATAWSFDRLRLWLERTVDPAIALRQAIIHGIARLALAGIFAWQGLIPKLLARDPDELAMLRDGGISAAAAPQVLNYVGIAELLLALILLVTWRSRWPSILIVGLMILVTVAVLVTSRAYFTAAFNPLTLNLAVAALALIDIVALRDTPSAARCLRTPPRVP